MRGDTRARAVLRIIDQRVRLLGLRDSAVHQDQHGGLRHLVVHRKETQGMQQAGEDPVAPRVVNLDTPAVKPQLLCLDKSLDAATDHANSSKQ